MVAFSEFCSSGSLDFTPPVWLRHGHKSSIAVVVGTPFVIAEGVGAGMRTVANLIDVSIWVQTNDDTTKERDTRRNTGEGTNNDAKESVRFWHWWVAGGRMFFTADRPWERVCLIISGERLSGLTDSGIA